MRNFQGVITTGIYCRPGCPGTPLRRNTLPFDHAAAAEAAGFRPCLRCRPELAPGNASVSVQYQTLTSSATDVLDVEVDNVASLSASCAPYGDQVGAPGVVRGVIVVALQPRMRDFRARVRQGFAVMRPFERYLREVVTWQALSWVFRFVSVIFFLRAFGISPPPGPDAGP